MVTIWDCEAEDLSLAVRFLRALRGWTQTELAEKAGWSKSRISLLEAGKEAPDEDDLRHLAAVVGLQLHLLDSCLPLLRLLRLDLGKETRLRNRPGRHVAYNAEEIASGVAATSPGAGGVGQAGGGAPLVTAFTRPASRAKAVLKESISVLTGRNSVSPRRAAVLLRRGTVLIRRAFVLIRRDSVPIRRRMVLNRRGSVLK